jgi:predicted ATPase/DNA-binding SARP family transcriptional activator
MAMLLRLLGRPALLDGGVWTELPSLKSSALFAFLAHQERWVHRSELTFLLWPDIEQQRANTNLRQLLTTTARTPWGSSLERERRRVRCLIDSDIAAFARAAYEGRVEDALEVYTGTFLDGFVIDDSPEFDAWVDLERTALHDRWRSLALGAIDRSTHDRNHADALALAERLVAADPLDEEAARRAMAAAHALGDAPRALRVFAALIATLRRDLDTEPAAATAEAAERIRLQPRQDASAEHVESIDRSAGTRSNLPSITTSFVGRAREVRELRTLLTGAARLVTLLGLGGIGKTRLSLALARDQLERGEIDRAFLVALEAVSDPQEVVTRVAAALGLPLMRAAHVGDVAREIAEARVLLVLDNFEQLTLGGPILLELLEACPNLRLVVTSREPLALAEEYLYPVEGLAFPDDVRDALERTSSFDALQLFVQRATRSTPRFVLTPANTPAVLGICRRLDGSPLGIELAAALVRTIPPDDVLAELEQSLDVLTSLERNTPDRHASLRAAFEHAWRLLSPAQQDALRRLTVFQDGCTRHAATDATGATIPLLGALTDRALLRSRDGRFYLHPLVQRYAAEKLAEDADVEIDAHRRHAEYFASFVERLSGWDPPREHKARVAEVVRELTNVRQAWTWAVRHRREDLLERSTYMLLFAMNDAGMRTELEAMIDAAAEHVRSGSLAGAHLRAVKSRLAPNGDPRQYPLREQALALYRLYGSQYDVARALDYLGIAAAHLHRHDEARSHLRESLAVYRQEASDTDGVAGALHDLALVTEEPREASRLYREAIVHSRRTEQVLLLSNHYGCLALLLAATDGDHAVSLTLMEEAIALERRHIRLGTGVALRTIQAGTHCLDLGDAQAAERHFAEASRLLEGPNHFETATVPENLAAAQALLHYLRGNVDQARALVEPHVKASTSCSELLVRIALDAGDLEAASHRIGEMQAGLDCTPAVNMLSWQAKTHLLHAEIARQRQQDAREHMIDALQIITRYGFVPAALDAFVTAASLEPGSANDDLLGLAAVHPAATCLTRMRATRVLGGTASIRIKEAPVGAEGVLTRAADLVTRLTAITVAG